MKNDKDGFPRIKEFDTMEGKRRRLRYLVISIGAFLLMICVFLILFMAYQRYGQARLANYAATHDGPDIESLQADIVMGGWAEEYAELADGQLYYKGKLYEFNEDNLVFLLLGVDSSDGIKEVKQPGLAGHADTIALVVFDEVTKSLKMIYLSRSIMVPVQTYCMDGFYTGRQEMQLALQYAYGDNREKSIRFMEEAVSKLFYGIPIHGSVALEMQGVAVLNDMIGGVKVTVIEDLSKSDHSHLNEGKTVILSGDEALTYVRYRNREVAGSNSLRMERQKQYITAFFAGVRTKTREQWSFPIRLYGVAKDHILTGITADQVAYLSTAVLGSSFSDNDIIPLVGTLTSPTHIEEFRVDEEELFDLIVNIFYREVTD